MPPRFAYWTILIDDAPTAFRARDPQELAPTMAQLKRTNPNVVMKWFARGRLWESMEQEHEDFRQTKVHEKRTRDWRPGGDHKDPRARFDKEKRRRDKRELRDNRDAKPPRPLPPGPQSERSANERPPRRDQERPSTGNPAGGEWKPKPGPGRPWTGKPRRDRPGTAKTEGDPAGETKPEGDRP